ncbi:MAG: lytic transglycosylase domain-containing protein [Candidatus Omnitrophota bacterium]
MDYLYVLYKSIIKDGSKVNVAIFFLLFCFCLLIFLPDVCADDLSRIVSMVSQEFGVDEATIYKVIEIESSFNPRAVSSCDARGLMQVTRQTWDWICTDYLKVSWNFQECAFDQEKNVIVGVRFLKWIDDYLDSHNSELNESKENLVLACYNAGPGAVRNSGFRIPQYSETMNYVKKINNL